MQILAYQNLFIRQELANGSSLSNRLSGIAKIQNADWDRLKESIEYVLKFRDWPYLRLNENRTEWQRGEKMNGSFLLDDFYNEPFRWIIYGLFLWLKVMGLSS